MSSCMLTLMVTGHTDSRVCCISTQAPPDQDGHQHTASAGPAPLAPSPLPPPPVATDIERLLASVTPALAEPAGPAAKPLTLVRPVVGVIAGSTYATWMYETACQCYAEPSCTLNAQSDLWAFYTEASVYGQEVFTCGGARG